MTFRIKAEPGTYAIHVRTTSSADDTVVAISGMQTSRLLGNTLWDAAGLLPNQTPMRVEGLDWRFNYVNGQQFIDIEVEPRQIGVPVGIAAIELVPLALPARPLGRLPTLFTLGDSTVKSYTFDEAPMNGWGQVIDNLFDLNRIRVVNYSQGGRSFRNAYAEGRLNDLLLAGYPGDVVMIQFGHNDEMEDETRRFGRGATEAMYESMIRDVYLPAIRARGMHPIFVTPMSRAGETPGKTNDGSFANGHPSNKVDGTHFKETLAKQFARLVVSELVRLSAQENAVAASLASTLRPQVKSAIATGDWSAIYPEIAADISVGAAAYYRNQIEKLLQLGVLSKDQQGNFNPDHPIRAREFATALGQLLQLPHSFPGAYPEQMLTRELMAVVIDDAYHLRFSTKPRYMTDYNGKTVVPGMAGYDPNLDSGAKGAMYYPLVDWAQLTDKGEIAPAHAAKVRDAYELGLIRSEKDIVRGRMLNGRELEPQASVTRAKAAKALYFMWVLAQATNVENDKSSLGQPVK
eukprot:gene12715-12508_t